VEEEAFVSTAEYAATAKTVVEVAFVFITG
jgi:hypothetical protein